ncbi:MAG: hypothetical protein IJA23_02495 [Clostridia bacterium]|nr:hypothetical protein [Clostridia bacterium]
MSYKNSMKLFASNFTLVWKQALYMFICFMLFILSIYSTSIPIIDLLREHNIIAEIKMTVETAYKTPSAFALEFGNILKHIINVILSNFGSIWLSLLGFLVLGILLPYILFQMSSYNITSILYQKLTMNMDVPYIQNGFRLLKNSLIYALASIVLNLPFLFIIILLLEIYIAMAYSTITAIIGLVILFALLILFTSIQISFHTYFMSYMVEKDANPFVSYAKGLINVLKRFWKILSQSVILCLTIIFINGLIALFTFFSGLFITIPATFVLLSIYYLVVYFNMKGDRYYLADNMIFNPIKYQVKQDTFVGTEIPEEVKATELTTVVMKKKRNSKKTKTNKK